MIDGTCPLMWYVWRAETWNFTSSNWSSILITVVYKRQDQTLFHFVWIKHKLCYVQLNMRRFLKSSSQRRRCFLMFRIALLWLFLVPQNLQSQSLWQNELRLYLASNIGFGKEIPSIFLTNCIEIFLNFYRHSNFVNLP